MVTEKCYESKCSLATSLIYSLDFTRWEGDVPDIGCSISSGCSDQDGLLAVPYYQEDNDEMSVNWNANDKEYEMPYVCVSKCPKYYLWYPLTGKCLKVVHSEDDTKLTIGQAMMQCSAENARLASFGTCNKMKTIMQEIYDQFGKDDQEYFVGNFFFKKPEQKFYRNWEENEIIDSLGHGVFEMDEPSGALCSFGSDDSIPSSSTAEAFVAFKIVDDSNHELKITQYNQDDYTADRVEAGYICEKEGKILFSYSL